MILGSRPGWRWHTEPGLVARRDLSVPLLLECEQCDATHPEYGRCEGIRNHAATGPLAWQHGNRTGGWGAPRRSTRPPGES